MGEALASRYWCHRCLQMVNPVMEVEVKCPFCQSGFVEEMDSRRDDDDNNDLASDRALSLLAPILLGVLGGPRRRRLRREEDEEEERSQSEDRDSEGLDRSRRRSSAAILQLLEGLRVETTSESENSENERDPERMILINPFNRTVILRGSSDSDQSRNDSQNIYSSLGDYFIGPGLDMLLQHLAENDPNRNGTPPAQKEAIEAMPTVKIEENLQCSVCLDDFEIGSEAKEMPFCRFQMPADGSKDSNGSGNNSSREERGDEEGNENGRRFWVPVPWPFSGLFSTSRARSGRTSTSPSSSTPESESNSHANEN
ncbi:E3 ubiquitin-protein ligase RING1-like protein [Cinnamomum micranthum f. kanehirae]|uniref:RING-type E3 ubiquitin transferase n=1 Tax=Cinnamomum micranthum f. kanehirae TaxID=337451 RepID=A0A3S3M0M2_9MAGN|nr:E3 ubiquitin-protein ligase RING1-like protein [Cinnamomum micranthum f. kanehirae]